MHSLVFGKESLFLTRAANPLQSLELPFATALPRLANRLPSSSKPIPFQCLLGLKYISGVPVLLLGLESKATASIETAQVFEVKKVGFVAVAAEEEQEGLLKGLAAELGPLEALFALGFHYYSQYYDLSVPYLFNRLPRPEITSSERRYYDQFLWNHNLARLDGQGEGEAVDLFWHFCDKVIQGCVGEYGCRLPGGSIKYLLISRRSHKKAGTRFYSRGIDDRGNVANFTESEQVIFLGDYVFTQLQLRGSVPAFFAQVGVNGIGHQTVVERSLDLTRGAFLKHFAALKQVYGRVLVVNLLSEKKPEEKLLTHFFESLVQGEADSQSYLRYQFYDFHEECKNNRFENSRSLLERLSGTLEALGYAVLQVRTGRLVCQQRGVVRSNCLDCLDRTNYVMSRIALEGVRHFLERFSHEAIHSLCQEKALLDLPVNESYPLLRGFSQLWADNGDAISLLYTGIGSTHTDITRTGVRTLVGAVNHKLRSLMRFYEQFNDHHKQQAINSIVTPSVLSPHRNGASQFHATLLLSFDNDLPIEDAVQQLRDHTGKATPTIVVCFVFEKKEGSFFGRLACMMGDKTGDFKVWEQTIGDEVEEEGYTRVGSVMAERSWMGVFCLKTAIGQVGQVRQEDLSRHISSGEALLVKLRLRQSSFIFAGVNARSFNEYLTIFDQLHEKGFQIRQLGLFQSSSFLELDYRVVLGNTGSEVLMPEGELRELRLKFEQCRARDEERGCIKILHRVLDRDQFGLEESRYGNKFLRQYDEGPIDFIPGANRIVFWNEESVVLRVREYQDIGRGSIACLFDYEIGLSSRSSLSYCPP